MKNFFLITGGRTGSTAVIDELDKSKGICAVQELFMIIENGKKEDYIYSYNVVMPFDLWKVDTFWRKNLSSLIHSDTRKARQYLYKAESLARQQHARSFGFKVLSSHLDERPYLGQLLKRLNYQAIYLTRNLARQVLSGMVANQRGVFGVSKEFEDTRRYHIDVDKFQKAVAWRKIAEEMNRTWLKTNGFPFIEVAYEDFLSNRESFYKKIFEFLDVPTELPPPSDWGIAIKDLRYTIENYDAVAEKAAELGISLDA